MVKTKKASCVVAFYSKFCKEEPCTAYSSRRVKNLRQLVFINKIQTNLSLIEKEGSLRQ